MKTIIAAVLVGLALVVAMAASDVTGTWEVDATFDDARMAGGGFDCAFKQNGDQLTGACSDGQAPLTGEVKGQTVTWRISAGNPPNTTAFTGTVDEAGRSMKGRFAREDKGGTFVATRQ
jgi:hypothetical protein